MEGAPGDECPIRAVPKAAEQENHERISDDLRLRTPATAQRDIHIIPEPGGQGDVPAAPELRDITAEIRHVEVLHRLEAEEFSRTDGHVRIPREIAIDLEGKEDGGQKQRAAALRLVGRKDAVHIDRTVVGDHHFLEQTPQNLAQPVHTRFIVEGPGLFQLRQKIRRPLDRARQQLREESDISAILDDIPRGLQFPPKYVDTITQRLERVETDADRKNYFQQQTVRLPAEESIRKGGDKEVVILEYPQNQQVDDDVQDVGRLRLPRCIPVLFNGQPAGITEQRRKGKQHQKTPVPPSIKDVGGSHDKEVLQFQVPIENEPIEQKHYREENGEFYGIEKHPMLHLLN